MVSADNLNLDVLEEIFSYLPHGSGLASIALVSRSFLEAVVPRLYAIITFHTRQAKGYPEGTTPFGTILAHPELATYVRSVEIYDIPKSQKANRLCKNLNSFKTTVPGAALYFFPSITNKSRLEKLCIYANLTMAQSERLLSLPPVKSLELQAGLWSVVDILPKWIQTSLHRSLRHLTLYMMTELNEDVLEAALKQLPDLRGLHIIGCPKADHNCVLRVTRHTPLLENLSMSTSEVNKIMGLSPSELSCIRNLALDSRSPDPQEIISAIFQYLRATYFPMTSFKLRVSQKKHVIPYEFIKNLTGVYGHSLRRLSFLDCEVQMNSISHVCKRCPSLERLDVAISMKESNAFAKAISQANNLRLIVCADYHVQHGPRSYLTSDTVELFMSCAVKLKTIIDGNRIWTRARTKSNVSSVTLERKQTRNPRTYWFLPQEV